MAAPATDDSFDLMSYRTSMRLSWSTHRRAERPVAVRTDTPFPDDLQLHSD